MPSTITSIIVFVGTGLSTYWRDIGGAAIVFHTIKSVLFGKTIKTVEYPSGNMRTINVHFPTVRSMRRRIAVANQLEDSAMVKQMVSTFDWHN